MGSLERAGGRMTQILKNPVLAGTGSEVVFSGQLSASDYSHNAPKVHRAVQAARLRHRFGMPQVRADLIACLAFGGRTHG